MRFLLPGRIDSIVGWRLRGDWRSVRSLSSLPPNRKTIGAGLLCLSIVSRYGVNVYAKYRASFLEALHDLIADPDPCVSVRTDKDTGHGRAIKSRVYRAFEGYVPLFFGASMSTG